MKVINANLNEGGSKPDKIKIIPISDVHLGDELCNTGITEAELSGKIKKIRLSM